MSTMTKTNSNEIKLEKVLKRIDQNLKKEVSFRHNFMLGVIRGVGTVIGATIVAGFVIMILSQLIKSVDDIPILNTILSSEELKELIETPTQ